MKKTISLVLAFVLVLALAIPAGAVNVNAATADDTERYGDVLDLGRFIRADDKDESLKAEQDSMLAEQAKELNFDEEADSSSNRAMTTASTLGTSKYFLGYDNGAYYFKYYTLRSIGNNVEIWVANDLGFYKKVGNDRYQPDPYGRAPYVVTDEQANMMKDTFDNIVYPTDTDFFGNPDPHRGENAALYTMGVGIPNGYYLPEDGIERVVILVDNVRDEQFYDPSYPFFIAGFYSPSYERYFDRNIINLDAKDWATRLENTYYGTAAHEFQHLIHDDNDPDEENWINEGMADYAEYLCFNEHAWGHINFFLDHPENSLVEWDEHYDAATGPETLADYGQAYLMQLYINEKFGKEFVRALALNELNGIESVNDQFEKSGIEDMDFEELFRRFTLAVAIDNPHPDDGIYNFETIDLKVDYDSALLFDKDGVPAWGADYKKLENANKIYSIKIDGIEYLPSPWINVSDPLGGSRQVLWGNNGHMRDNMLIMEADLTGVSAASLTFDNYYDIEDAWDAGMVQVSTDDGATWVSLANANTKLVDYFDPGVDPRIAANLPGLTGTNSSWNTETYNLSAYAGQKILINFRYMTDPATNGAGWFIDNVSIPEIGCSNDCDSMEGFIGLDELQGITVDYALSFINEKTQGYVKSKGKSQANIHYEVLNIDPLNITEADAIKLKGFFSGGNNYMIVWYAAPVGKMGPVDFSYQIVPKSQVGNKKPIHAKH